MKLADIIETFISGDWGEETVAEDTPNSVFCIRGADIVPITNHCFNGIPQRFVCDKTIENKTLKAGDLIIEKSGGSPTQSTGRIVYVSEDLIKAKGNVVCSNFCTAFRVKAGWNPLYVYYFWQNVYNHGAFFNFEGKTSGIKNLQLDNALSAIDIEYLPLEKQNRIVAYLSSIDEKIKVNRQINDNLEAMAKQLYDYWFVQFDFPNEEGKPYKSNGGAMVWNEKLKREIPQYWSTLPISTILDKYPTTKRYETKEYLSQGKYPIIDQGDTYIVGYTNEDDNLLTRHPAVLFGDHSTKVKFLDFDFARGADGTQILYSSNDAVSQYYLYLAVSTLQIPNPGYSRHFKYLKELPIVIPSLSIAIKFANIVKPLFKKWTNNIINNIALTKQRNELLPLLMNGQASVNYHLSAY